MTMGAALRARARGRHFLRRPLYVFNTEDALISAEKQAEAPVWLIDSGASKHMTGTLDHMVDRQPLAKALKVYGIGPDPLMATVKGNVALTSVVDGRVHRLKLRDVLYVPGLQHTLLSVTSMAMKGAMISFVDSHCNIDVNGLTHGAVRP